MFVSWHGERRKNSHIILELGTANGLMCLYISVKLRCPPPDELESVKIGTALFSSLLPRFFRISSNVQNNINHRLKDLSPSISISDVPIFVF